MILDKLKKALIFIPASLLLAPTILSCNKQDPNTIYLKVLNSEDYIYKYDEEEAKKGGNDKPDLTVQFEQYMAKKGKKVKVIYDTFDTMENMYNTLKTGKTKYDLICASEYMVQKLVKEDLVIKLKIDDDHIPMYNQGCSPFIRNQLNSISFKNNKNESRVLGDYCIDYMWGTLGIVYNPTYEEFKKRNISFEKIKKDAESFNILWNEDYKKTISIKDSMRDTYAVGLVHKYQDEFNNPEKTKEERNIIFNRGGEEDAEAQKHINEVQSDLLKLRQNIFGFEVDSGKEDICTGKIGINIAWSGDAVYSIDKACNPKETTEPFDLYFSLPKEGTNLWFDCWAMQENNHEDIVYEFLNFLSDPENAIQNMDYIGYTSPIADKEDIVFNWFQNEKYKPESAPEKRAPYDVKYFFDPNDKTGKYTFYIDENIVDRQMAAQFPKADVIDKLMIMKDYGKNNDLIMKMWEQVKHESLPTWAVILFAIEGAIIIGGISSIVIIKARNKRRRRERRLANVK